MSSFKKGIGHIVRRHCGTKVSRDVSIFFDHIDVSVVISSALTRSDLSFRHKYTPDRLWILRRFDSPIGLERFSRKKCFWLAVLRDDDRNLITAYPVSTPDELN